MPAEEWRAWGQGVLQNTVYMTVGMGVSKVAEMGAAMYKTRALVNTFKTAGKSFDEVKAIIKAIKISHSINSPLFKLYNLFILFSIIYLYNKLSVV